MSIAYLGRYEIVENLGQGAMGIVYKARDPLIERTVAIKTVACVGLSRDESEAFEQRFYREAKSAGRLNHPNIVTIHDVGKSDALAYIAMEFLEGRSLRQLLDSGVVLPADRIVEIAAQIADGLAFAHANDVVHRDIKPANVMVLDNGAVKIADFGVALLPSGSRTLAGTVFGSPKYMSPEQVTGRQVDGRSDIFSLGAVLYEMLTGLPPFAGDDLNAILYQVLNETPPPPSRRNPKLAPAFDWIVARAMAKNPGERYASADEMAADLRNHRRLAAPAASPADATAPAAAECAVGDATVQLVVASPAPLAAAPAAGRIGRGRKALLFGVPLGLLAMVAAWVAFPPGAQHTEAPAAASAVPPPVATPVAADAPPAVQAPARVKLAVTPWGEVYVDGRKEGVSPPLMELKLPPGKHSIEIRNATFPPRREVLDLAPDASARIKHKFH